MPSPAPKTPPPKKATQKRITNATMMDQLSALQAQGQALVSAQAAGCAANYRGGRRTYRSWSCPYKCLSNLPSVKKAAALVAPPPKSMAASPGPVKTRVVMPEDEPKDWKEGTAASGDPLLHAISQQGLH